MPLILGVDPSKSTGWGLFDPSELTPKFWGDAFECGVFELPAKADEYYTGELIGNGLTGLLAKCKEAYGHLPHFAVIEGQIKSQARDATGFGGSVYPWIATTAVTTTLGRFRIPYATIMPATWRVAFFGAGYKPPFKMVKRNKPDAHGNTEKKEYLWKDAVIDRCKELGIKLPNSKALADDAAEACAIAYCWQSPGIQFHAKRYHEPWMKLRSNDNRQESFFGEGGAA